MSDLNSNPHKKRRGCFRPFLIALMISILLFSGVFYVSYIRYNKWEESLFDQEDNVVTLNFEKRDFQDFREDLKRKTDTYVKSSDNIDILLLTPEDVSILLYDSLSSSLHSDIFVKEIHVLPDEGRWIVYLKSDWKGVEMPLISFLIISEKSETAEIFIRDAWVGKYSIKAVGGSQLIDDLNDGYRNALIFVNENGVTGRRFENIDLTDEYLIIKGEKDLE